MRIISEFKDYYDSAQCFGIDPELRYIRKQETYEYHPDNSFHAERKSRLPGNLDEILKEAIKVVSDLPRVFIRQLSKYQQHHLDIPVTAKLIGFCGQLHPAIEVGGTTYNSMEAMADGISDGFLKQFGLDRAAVRALLSQEFRVSPYWRRFRMTWAVPISYSLWQARTESVTGKRFDDIFVRLGLPIFRLEFIARNKSDRNSSFRDVNPNRIRCTLNPELKQDNFQKIKVPAEAFQEISMYLGNQLARQPDPIANVSDDILRDEKGFDKWSFRRHKEEDRKFKKKAHREQAKE